MTARLVPVQFHTWLLIGPRCHSEQLGPGCQRRVEESADKFATLFSFQRYLDFLTGTNNKNSKSKLEITKDYRVRATTIGGPNAYAPTL